VQCRVSGAAAAAAASSQRRPYRLLLLLLAGDAQSNASSRDSFRGVARRDR